MTLEEKIIFYSRSGASQFQKFLRDAGCSSRISVYQNFSGTPYYEGRISAFLQLIDKSLKREDDSQLIDLKEELNERLKIITEFFKNHKKGDILTEATPHQHLAQSTSINTVGSEIENFAAEKFAETMIIYETLDENNLIEPAEENDTYRLKSIADANDLIVSFPYTELSSVTKEDLCGIEISTHVISSSSEDYAVTADDDMVLSDIDLNDAADLLENLDVDEDEAARFIDNICFKQVLVSKIHEIVKSGIRSESEILNALNAPSFVLEGTNDKITFDITSEYLSGVINDLKKQNILCGKDGKIKTVNN